MSGNTMAKLLQRCLEDNRLRCQYRLQDDILTHTAGTTDRVNECFCYFSKLHLMNWGYKEPGCLANSGKYHWVVYLSSAILRATPDPSGAGGQIGYCRLHPPSPTLAMRERLNGILRCATWRFPRLSFEFSLRDRSSSQSRYTLKTIEQLVFSAALHFFLLLIFLCWK
jgi:hypothetical protein